MKQIHIPKLNYSNIEWIDSDDPKYKSRSRKAYPYCENCKKNHPENETEPKAYIYENAYGNLHLHCHRCRYSVSIAQFADFVIP